MLKTAWGFVTGALGGIYGYLAVFAIGLVIGAICTWRVMSWEAGSAQVQQVKTEVKYIAASGAATYKIGLDFSNLAATMKAANDQILLEVPIHVTPKVDTDYPVPLGFVRLFNDASHGAVPDASAGADGSPSGVALSTVAQTTVQDFGQCDTTSAQLIALQDWVTAQKAISDKTQ